MNEDPRASIKIILKIYNIKDYKDYRGEYLIFWVIIILIITYLFTSWYYDKEKFEPSKPSPYQCLCIRLINKSHLRHYVHCIIKLVNNFSKLQ